MEGTWDSHRECLALHCNCVPHSTNVGPLCCGTVDKSRLPGWPGRQSESILNWIAIHSALLSFFLSLQIQSTVQHKFIFLWLFWENYVCCCCGPLPSSSSFSFRFLQRISSGRCPKTKLKFDQNRVVVDCHWAELKESQPNQLWLESKCDYHRQRGLDKLYGRQAL